MPEYCVQTLDIAGLTIHGGSSSAAVTAILDQVQQGEKIRLGFCNAHTLALALKSRAFMESLSGLTLFNDGVGLDIAAMALRGRRFPDNLNGTDLVPRLLAAASGSRIFLLGGRDGVAAEAARRLQEAWPQHEIVGHHDGFFEPGETPGILDRIESLHTDILLLGMGHPRQEMFIARHGAHLNASLVICCGALLDFLAERVPRAPLLMRRLRLEWLFRLAHEPRRLAHRYTVEAAQLAITILKLKLLAAKRRPAIGRPGPAMESGQAFRLERPRTSPSEMDA